MQHEVQENRRQREDEASDGDAELDPAGGAHYADRPMRARTAGGAVGEVAGVAGAAREAARRFARSLDQSPDAPAGPDPGRDRPSPLGTRRRLLDADAKRPAALGTDGQRNRSVGAGATRRALLEMDSAGAVVEVPGVAGPARIGAPDPVLVELPAGIAAHGGLVGPLRVGAEPEPPDPALEPHGLGAGGFAKFQDEPQRQPEECGQVSEALQLEAGFDPKRCLHGAAHPEHEI